MKANEIVRRGTCVPAKGDEGTIAATCRAMNDEDARCLAAAIVDLYDKVCGLHALENHRAEEKR